MKKPSPAIQIRPVTQKDRARWEELFAAYATFYKTEIPNDGFDNVWNWIFDENNDFWCDLAQTADGEIIGFTQYQFMHRSLGGSMTVYMSDLFVDPKVRGSGAGRALIDHVIEFTKSKGLPSVRWLTQDFNYAGRRLYDTYQPKSDFIFYNIPV